MSHQKEIFVKIDQCTGCNTCRIACCVEHSQSRDLFRAMSETPRPKARVYVTWVEENIKVPVLCRHCEDAPCVHACISGAITRAENGAVITAADKCIGCWTCVMVCPYGVIGRDTEQQKAFRCDRCPDRDVPACVSACPTGALVYETVDEFSSGVRKKVSKEMVSGEKG